MYLQRPCATFIPLERVNHSGSLTNSRFLSTRRLIDYVELPYILKNEKIYRTGTVPVFQNVGSFHFNRPKVNTMPTATNPKDNAVQPSTSPGLVRLRLPSQVSINATPPPHLQSDSSPQLKALEQSLRQLIQSLLETAIMVHDLEDGSGELLFQKMYWHLFYILYLLQ